MITQVDLDGLLDIICAYASGDYEAGKESVSYDNEILDPIYAALHLLGEELEATTISKEYLNNLYRSINDPIFEIENYGQVLNHNEAGDQFLKKNTEFISFLFDNYLEDPLSFNFSEGELSKDIEVQFKKRHYIVTLTRVIEAEGKLFILVIKDITSQKKMEENLMRQEIKVQEKERIRLAQDLHDSLGQEMNAIRMFLTIAHKKVENPEAKQFVGNCIELIEKSIAEIRNISFNLMPASLTKGSFLDALKELIVRFNKQEKMGFYLLDEGEDIDYLPGQIATNIFRIIQEFFNNCQKYSNGTECLLKVCKQGNIISIKLIDNGIGFDFENAKNKGVGLTSMTNRLNTIQAKYNFITKVNKGVRLEILIDLDDVEDEKED